MREYSSSMRFKRMNSRARSCLGIADHRILLERVDGFVQGLRQQLDALAANLPATAGTD